MRFRARAKRVTTGVGDVRPMVGAVEVFTVPAPKDLQYELAPSLVINETASNHYNSGWMKYLRRKLDVRSDTSRTLHGWEALKIPGRVRARRRNVTAEVRTCITPHAIGASHLCRVAVHYITSEHPEPLNTLKQQ